MYLPSVGRTLRTTARISRLSLRELPVLEENIMCFTLTLVRSFPNPVPGGTRVPYWASLDVTVRCLSSLLC